MNRHIFAAVIAIVLLASAASAQRAEVTISLNEAFFDALLDSVYQNYDPPEFSIAGNFRDDAAANPSPAEEPSFSPTYLFARLYSLQPFGASNPYCAESVKILRETNGVRTAVRFREGKILVPLAFSGNYDPPFVGCIDFGGVAESNIDLEFDQASQRLIGRVHVSIVNLNGTRGIGGNVIAKLIQGSIDKKLNPIEILRLDKISFVIPVQNAGNIRMKAVAVTPEVAAGSLNVRITYEFAKG